MSDTKEPKFDESQQLAIDALNNSVVSAGAGSGKTTVLSQRFLKLVTPKSEGGRGFHVDEVLTLTFTKKATVEMSSRIYKVLKQNGNPEANDFYKANIKTLDSYCNSVAKMGCHFYGISPDFTQDDEAITTYANQIALPLILSNKDNEGIKALVTTNDYMDIADQLFTSSILNHSTIVTPLNFREMLEKQIESSKTIWEENIKNSKKTINDMSFIFNSFEGNTDSPTYKKIAVAMKNLGDISVLDKNIGLFSKNALEPFDFIQNASKTPKAGNVKMEGFSACIDVLKTNTVQLQGLINFKENLSILENLIPLLEEFQNEMNEFKRKSGLLTFADIAQIAVLTLSEHPEIRQVEKAKYKAIMIDEFQDNNSLQRDMLFLLAENRERNEKGVPSVAELEKDKLFFVGDEKQSIYLFRGADVSVFRALSSDFAEGNLQMATNYRSVPALIASFNTIFGGVPYPIAENSGEDSTYMPSAFFTEHDEKLAAQKVREEIPNFEAVYHKVEIPKSKLEEAEKQGLKNVYKSHVHFALYDGNQEKDENMLCDEEAEAEWIAQKIEEIVKNGVDGLEKVEYSDIAILTRNYSLLPIYEKTFLRHGIPYDSETAKGIFSDGPVNDIYSLLRICAYPSDKLAYASFLASPLVNLDAQNIQILLAQNKNYDDSPDFVPFSEKIDKILDEENKKRFEHAKGIYESLLLSSKTENLTNLISKIWYDFGYRYETMWNSKVEMFEKMYDILFEMARTCDEKNISLAAFTDILRDFKDDNKKLDNLNILLEQTEGVHIMSIHKSKGLEFPVVFLAATQKGPNNQEDRQKIQYSKEYGVTIKGISDVFYKLGGDDRIEAAELRRLAYVAITRAINTAYITNGKYSEPSKEKDRKDYSATGESLPNTIFNVFRPSFYYYEGEKAFADKDSQQKGFFDVVKIPQFPRFVSSDNLNTQEAKSKLQKEVLQNESLKDAKIVKTDNEKSRYLNASHLEECLGIVEGNDCDGGNSARVDDSVGGNSARGGNNSITTLEQDPAIAEIDAIIDSTKPKDSDKPRFNYADFGTIAHAFMEAAVKGSPVMLKQKNVVELTTIGKDDKRLERVLKICERMTEKFCQSEIGKQAINSKWHKCEYDFSWRPESWNPEVLKAKEELFKDKILNGSIDLVFQDNDGNYSIVDYKTDKEVKPETHFVQLACYRKALSEMLGVKIEKIRCVLYYLRFAKEVDITENCK